MVIDLKGSLPEYVQPLPRWQRYLPILGIPVSSRPLSLAALRNVLERITADPRPKGIVIKLDHLNVGWATAQSLRQALALFRKSGKRVVAYCGRDFDTSTYFVACAADDILAPPSASWMVVGLRAESVYLKDALETWGIEADVIAVSPYKTGGEMFVRSEMSEENREMLNWRLDGYYETLLDAIAAGRNLDKEQVRQKIDQAPFTASDALEAGLLDGVLYFDEAANYLSGGTKKDETPEPATLVTIERVARALCYPARWRSGKLIAVVSVEGAIIPGDSQDIPSPIPIPVFGNKQAGSDTITQMLRGVETNDLFEAVVLHVDSPGGSGLASDLIWREVERIRKKKPVVVFMGNVAASGGYYVSATADWIVAQPLTVTGSIGVWMVKLTTTGLFSRIKINRVSLQRGAHAGIYADSEPFDEQLRDLVVINVNATYAQFKEKVIAGREIAPEKLESIAGGKVWLGCQALEHGLVDELGDLETAIAKAKELAKIPTDRWTPVAWISNGKGNHLPVPFPLSQAGGVDWMDMLNQILKERVWMIDPYHIDIK